MVDPKAGKRYVVSNFGFGWAVQDTGDPVSYARPAKNEHTESSSNPRNVRLLEVFPTRAQAQAYADECNAKAGAPR